ncbi:MAG: hypothetical protein U0326_34905 [Polyangiales bacterium]
MSARPMKDTGIEWIGQIPRTGRCGDSRAFPNASKQARSAVNCMGDYVDGGVPIINPSHLSDGSIRPDVDAFPATAAPKDIASR